MIISGATLVAPLAVLSGAANANSSSTRIVTIGPAGDHPTLRSAVEAIRPLASLSSPFVLYLLPGRHEHTNSTLLIPPFVAVQGSGRETTTLVLSGNSSRLRFSANCTVSDLSIEAHRTGAQATSGMIDVHWSRVVDFSVNRVNLFLTGGTGSAIDLASGGGNTVAYLSDVNIFTTSLGIVCRGFNYLRGVNVFLSGNQTNTPYIGLFVPAMCRLYAWSCKIGTGYGETTRPGFGTALEVLNDPNADVIGMYVPASNTAAPRLQIHSLESYCRNDQAVTATISCVLAEAGIARVFGSFLQTETPANWQLGAALRSSGSATLEVYGSTYNSASGKLSSRNQEALTHLDTGDSGITLVPGVSGFHPGSAILCDAAAGSFIVNLAGDWAGGQPPGVQWTFIKSDQSTNTVTVRPGPGGSISGSPELVLARPFASARLMHGDAGTNRWYVV